MIPVNVLQCDQGKDEMDEQHHPRFNRLPLIETNKKLNICKQICFVWILCDNLVLLEISYLVSYGKKHTVRTSRNCTDREFGLKTKRLVWCG